MENNLLLIAICFSSILKSQIGFGTASPNPNSALELSSASKGLLLPRIQLSSTALSTPLANHEKGMIVYNISVMNDVAEILYIKDGFKRQRLYTNQRNIGNVYA